MASKSSYLRFLPPVLWQEEPAAPEFSLGTSLRIFEKLLSGIDDGVVVQSTAPDGKVRQYDGIEPVIASLFRLFSPWTTPPEFLPWLASWVSLEFPEIWDEYQRRKVTSESVQIYRKHGLKRGLDEYFDLYTVAEKRPRVAVDDGGRILFAEPVINRFATITPLISHGPTARKDKTLALNGAVQPWCIARAPDGALITGGPGTPAYWPTIVDEAVWSMPPPGRYTMSGTPPKPGPIGPQPWIAANPGAPVFPIAVAIDAQSPWGVYVLDDVTNALQTALYRLPSPTFSPVAQLATKNQLTVSTPIAMAFDPANGHLLILDRAGGPGPRVLDVDVTVGPPPTVTAHVLTQVVEPLSIAVLADGNLIIGDGREQNLPTAGDLIHVNRANPIAWVESRLLGALAAGANPLVSPTAVVQTSPTRLLVLDTGVKPIIPALANPFDAEIAEPAALYWVDSAPTVVTRASETKSLVYPRGMVYDGTSVFICDPGQPQAAGLQPRVFRAMAHEFGVVVHFSKQRPTTVDDRRKILGNIRDILAEGKPAQTVVAVVSIA